MANSLRTVIVDDSVSDCKVLKELLAYCSKVNVLKVFNNPQEFLEQVPSLHIDLCLLDINMPEMNGLLVAQLIKNIPVIFVTGIDEKLKTAIELNPVDIIFKPINVCRLNDAIEKAFRQVHNSREYAVFIVAESARKIKIRLADIVYVTTSENDSRQKIVFLSNGKKYTLMNYTFEQLLEIHMNLVQVNKSDLVSLDYIDEVEYGLVTLLNVYDKGGNVKEIYLGNLYRNNLYKRIFFK
ncbi:MAG TPA: LytTR family DNA-binding domain-containing protein [Bacteroidia bacterium]|jgi:two-component system LytT family response regulator|nr:LytTR family DNA-binding domain-containing protein [Bacteroidia bacterium]